MMRRARVLAALATVCAACATAVGQTPAAGGDAWDRLLASVGLTRPEVRFDPLDLGTYGGDAYRVPYFTALHADPLRIPSHARIFRAAALAQAGEPGGLAMQAAGRIDAGTRLTLLGDPLKDDAERSARPGALVAAIVEAHRDGGAALDTATRSRLNAAVRGVPAPVARQAAFALFVQVRALRWRERGLKAVTAADRRAVFAEVTAPPPGDDAEDARDAVAAAGARADLSYLMVGGELTAMAAHRAALELAKVPVTAPFAFTWDTPLGRICLNGAGTSTVPAGRPYLLVVDTAGEDVYYAGGGTTGPANPVSVLIDVAGDDRYIGSPGLTESPVAGHAGRKRASAAPSFGAGVLGYGVLVDLTGNDTYRGLSNTQGAGVIGLGALIDGDGDDTYDGYAKAQGAADWGVGVLADLGGRDRYLCFTTSQGYGGTRGCGLLVDAGPGDDAYEANDTAIDFPSPQTAEHNVSMSQGAAYGRRADYSDGHSRAGGVGALVDGGGTNRFTCGVFGQGVGYWFGVGMLLAGPGADTYAGVWYTGGSAAHFAVGVLADAGGDDDYAATMNMALGAGHDFSTGFLFDEGGNDRYRAPNLSLGGGNANGFGFLWDRAGDDTYVVSRSVTLGRGAGGSPPDTLRHRNFTLGLFLDTGGRDTYPADQPWATNDAAWTMAHSGPAPEPNARGGGLDAEAHDTKEPG